MTSKDEYVSLPVALTDQFRLYRVASSTLSCFGASVHSLRRDCICLAYVMSRLHPLCVTCVRPFTGREVVVGSIRLCCLMSSDVG